MRTPVASDRPRKACDPFGISEAAPSPQTTKRLTTAAADGSGGVVDLRRFHSLITAHSNLTWRFSRLFGNSKRRNDRSDSSSPLNQINNQYDDCNYEEEMNQTAPNVTNEAKQPKHDQNNNYSPEHG